MMKAKIIDIDTLCSVCGYFTSNTDANNHYGCNHPDQEEYEDCYKDEDGYTHRSDKEPQVKQGKCYSFSCPLAHECDLQDLKENNSEYYEDYKDAENPDCLDAGLVCYYYEDDNDKIASKLT